MAFPLKEILMLAALLSLLATGSAGSSEGADTDGGLLTVIGGLLGGLLGG
jgi:hypothetical protein